MRSSTKCKKKLSVVKIVSLHREGGDEEGAEWMVRGEEGEERRMEGEGEEDMDTEDEEEADEEEEGSKASHLLSFAVISCHTIPSFHAWGY